MVRAVAVAMHVIGSSPIITFYFTKVNLLLCSLVVKLTAHNGED